MALTKKQMEAVMKFWKQGWFYSWNLHSIFATDTAKRNCIKTLVSCGIIEEHNFRFHINRERFLEYQAEFENKKLDDYGAQIN